MPAPQQANQSIYKETANIPRPRIDQYLHDSRDSAGASLARMLRVGGKVLGGKIKDNKQKQEEYENEIRVAHAQIGLGDFNNTQARGGIDLLNGDHDEDVYAAKQGEIAGASYSGELRDKYMNDGIYDSADPGAFRDWLLANSAEKIAESKKRGPSYHASFMRQLGKNAELMSKQFAGHSQDILERSTQTAAKERLRMAREADKYVNQQTALGGWMKGFLQSESAGNWNAWFGNSGNKEDLSQLNLKEILSRQDEPGNDAAGLIQIVPGTLRNVMKKYGYTEDMMFTPQLQTEMALLLMKEKGLDKWLRNEIPDGVMANRLASVWAGLKTSDGKGVYDGDGVNKGHQGHGTTVSQLGELRYLMSQNPELAEWIKKKDPKAGETAKIIGPTGTPSNVEVGKVLEDVEGSGRDYVQLRDDYTSILEDEIDKGEIGFDDDGIEAEIKAAKLNKIQAQRVRSAASIKKSTAELEALEERKANVGSLDNLIRTGEGLVELRAKAPKVAQRIMELKVGIGDTTVDREAQQQSSLKFLEDANYGDPDFRESAIKAYLAGQIDEYTYKLASQQLDIETAASKITSIPAVSQTLNTLEGQLPTNVKSLFKSQVSLILSELSEGEEKPKVSEVLQAIDGVAQRLSVTAGDDAASRMNRPEYNIKG